MKKKFFALLLAVSMVIGMSPITAMAANNFAKTRVWDDAQFTDVAKGDWFYENVKEAYELGLMLGCGDGAFDPYGKITLAQTVAVAARIHAIATTGEDNFVQGSPWYRVYVDYALANGILDGELADYNQEATRLDFARILAHALPAKDLKAINDVDYGDIPDVANDEAVYTLYRAGVLVGKDNGEFGPTDIIDRSQMATIVARMALPELRQKIETEEDDSGSGNLIIRPSFDWPDFDWPDFGWGDDEDEPSAEPSPEPSPEPEDDVSVTVPVESENGAVKNEVSLEAEDVKATVPAGVTLTEGAEELTLTVNAMESTGSDVTLGENEEMVSYDVHVEGVAEDNTVVITVEMGAILPKGLNMGNVALYHVEDGVTNAMTQVSTTAELDEHNEFYYDPATGEVTVAMASFSELVSTYNTENAWNGEYDYTWYTETIAANADATEFVIANADQLAGFGAIVGGMDGQTQDSFSGKTVKLIVDVDLGGAENVDAEGNRIIFYPIGYYNNTGSYTKQADVSVTSNVSSFEGTFDGNGNTISNFYQNTWEMFGDYNSGYEGTPNHYKDAMGLFGYVVNGTVKNLTVDNFSSDGEFTPTGVIAAYAVNSTFENIAITNCNPRVYNTGNGGIVGIGGNSDDPDTYKLTFTNITIDNSNIISALWGSWDVACGGLVGMFRGAGHVYMTNCHVAAQMDVYNDVCGNYQYYWYRYSGMMVGTNKNMTTDENGYTVPETSKYHAENCTVHFGEWNDYYYCELVANSLASYTHDHQFSRLTEVDSVDVDNMTVTVNGVTTAIPTSGRYNYVVVNGEASTENATCYHFVDGAVWHHEDAGFEDFDLDGNGELDDYQEDRQHYYLPFNQLFTGYGWGVKHIPIYDDGTPNPFAGVAILGREVADSVDKFAVVSPLPESIVAGTEYTVGDFFAAVAEPEVSVDVDNVQVFVSPADSSNMVYADYVADTETWQNGTLKFYGYGEAVITITDYHYCNPVTITVTVTGSGILYRVGNQNEVTYPQLAYLLTGNTSYSSVKVTTPYDHSVTASVSGTAVNFTDTGIAGVEINGVQYYVEVVDAWNTTSAKDAVSSNVVLLNDISGGFTVSNGNAFYGNGFTVTCSGNGSYGSKALSYGFVTVKDGGVLDNVQIICDVFPESYLYTTEMAADSNGRYPYAYSAVAVNGNSTISNCYIYGARNNIFVGSGNVTIENTVTESGSLSNIQVKSSDAYTVILDNVTTIQYQTTSSYDTSKTVLGFGVVVGDNESASNPVVKLTGDLKQYNWVTSADTSVSNSYAQMAIKAALEVTAYQHTINDVTNVNTGIAFLNTQTATIADERENKDAVPYVLNKITMNSVEGQVYSISGGTITAESRYDAKTDGVIPYVPKTNRGILPTITLNSAMTAVTLESGYNATEGAYVNKVVVDLDNIDGGSYDFKFADLTVTKYGIPLVFEVKDSGGNTVDKNTAITLNQLSSSEYILVVTDNQIYGVTGSASGSSEYELPFVLYATKTSIDPPKFTNAGTATAIRLVTSSGGDWRPAYTVLTGVSVTYWSASESKVKTVDLSTLYNSGTISSNVWTYTCDDYTLTITGGAVHSDGSVITPVVANNTLYFASTNKAFTTSTTSRNIVLTYVFTDKNASTTWNRTETVTYSELSEYDYDSFKNNGTLTEASSSGCVTPDTLITLADGSQVRVESLTGDEELLVWNLETGALDSALIMFVDNDPAIECEVIRLRFSDDTEVNVLYDHGFWDYDLNKYVYLDRNAADYIGHSFAKQNGDALEKVQLVDVVIETEVTTAWSPVTVGHLCYFVNGMLSMPGGVGGLFNIFDVEPETMTYDFEAMERDIEAYGLFTYEELNSIAPLSEEMFNAAGGAYLKISIGKGNLTMEELIYMINRYSKFFE